jgi:hypothetical protein
MATEVAISLQGTNTCTDKSDTLANKNRSKPPVANDSLQFEKRKIMNLSFQHTKYKQQVSMQSSKN